MPSRSADDGQWQSNLESRAFTARALQDWPFDGQPTRQSIGQYNVDSDLPRDLCHSLENLQAIIAELRQNEPFINITLPVSQNDTRSNASVGHAQEPNHRAGIGYCASLTTSSTPDVDPFTYCLIDPVGRCKIPASSIEESWKNLTGNLMQEYNPARGTLQNEAFDQEVVSYGAEAKGLAALTIRWNLDNCRQFDIFKIRKAMVKARMLCTEAYKGKSFSQVIVQVKLDDRLLLYMVFDAVE